MNQEEVNKATNYFIEALARWHANTEYDKSTVNHKEVKFRARVLLDMYEGTNSNKEYIKKHLLEDMKGLQEHIKNNEGMYIAPNNTYIPYWIESLEKL